MNKSPTISEKIIAPFKQSKMFNMLILGYASGLPLMLTASSLFLWYKDNNIQVKDIGFLTLIAMPYTFKYLWAPILDKISIKGFSRRKGWILITQIVLILLIALMSRFSPANSPLTIAFIAFLICLTSATQDIAINAYQTETLDESERALGNAVAVMGYRIGMLITGSILLILVDSFNHSYNPEQICFLPYEITSFINPSIHLDSLILVSSNESVNHIINSGWANALLVILVFFIICPIFTIFLKESSKIVAPRTFKEAFISPFVEFMTRKGVTSALLILAILVAYKLADAIAFSLNSVFFVDLGFDKTTIAVSYKALSLVFTIFGLIFGGVVAKEIGVYKSFLYFSIIMACANLMYFLLAIIGKNYNLMIASVAVEYFCGAMGTAILVAMIMSLVNVKFSATQFAILSSIDSLGRVLVGPLAGYIQYHYDWSGLFIFSFIVGIVVSLIIYIFKNQIKAMADLK
ncbi:MFS transporter [Allofrancisella guangzhouensis]|uniref:Major facilitator transporter n=1 Tax=Allofrancisella guangzhouensis TaxID=594679 RepID=A0A0A8E2Y1_9GAMM|nr:MFS transporter [Allofrancisella guangzhouensis]AJC48319.1 major facilitator transporter [Allofrancisella guangzhouensis]MBK2026595.1 MFS transporter [Allofrancisella guangzhouensis]MBK2044339.1 MFS transporter [Allofrancisella guangzhouensis]MBK2045582.1 MFS transporter [Allofrancisella guangzhouensis]